jgi:AraC family transcriptional regulator, regulatory protein of adaptative response / DNA-3-methyladenine glycosylase II
VVEDFDRCYRAVQSRDPRFDGWFFTAVTSTGIYCRPSCPAMTPKPENVRFYPSSAAAQGAGFRACKRCRPDAAPGSPEWNGRADVVARAMRLIADGAIDRGGVPGLAAKLGYSVRQLQRVLTAELGAGPLALARAQRAQTARTLIETTSLPMADVAFAAGFSSIRQFNDTLRSVFALTPRELRRRAGSVGASRDTLSLRLPFRQPLSQENLFAQLAATTLPGVAEVRDGSYRRTLRLPRGSGIVELRPLGNHIACRLMLDDLRDLTSAVARCRWLLDLDADPEAVDDVLRADTKLRPVIERTPGCRVSRCVDGAELAIRTLLGRRASAGVARLGDPVFDAQGGLAHTFPAPDALKNLHEHIAPSRRRALAALIGAITSGDLVLGPDADREAAVKTLAGLPGVSVRVAQTIAVRALGDPDAFFPTGRDAQRATKILGQPTSTAALSERAARWRPWRAYAAQYLWSTG